MHAKDRVYNAMKKLCLDRDKITALELSKMLDLSRQVVSHYLNRLLEENLVKKTSSRPVYWSIANVCETKNPSDKKDVFSNLIGAYGSQKKVIEQCKAAVNYPPKGLSILITGESGVGKSFLAGLIYEYALDQKIISDKAPFVVLNCADYANNPELLSATLLGYKKGSFTGADSDKEGLLHQADGGYLFLDEIHRLSYANQEKLFLFMDTGKYRQLGNNDWKRANVRFIFATTESAEEVLLETFRRRITVNVCINSIIDRPFTERLQMVYLFYYKEAKKIQKYIEVDVHVVEVLCFSKLKGNIGTMQNIVQISCANAFTRQINESSLKITLQDIPYIPSISFDPSIRKLSPLKILYNDKLPKVEYGDISNIRQKFIEFFQYISKTSFYNVESAKLEISVVFKNLINSTKNYFEVVLLEQNLFVRESFRENYKKIIKRYGIDCPKESLKLIYCLILIFQDDMLVKFDFDKIIEFLDSIWPRTHYIAVKLSEELGTIASGVNKSLEIINTIFFQEYVVETIELQGLIVAHGNATASSIQSVANQNCGTFVFESIDMPMEISSDETIQKVNKYLEKVNTSKGLILLVDMGSLNQMYSSIKNHLSGDLLIMNNVTTAIAMDIGIKILQNMPFKDIAERSNNAYKIGIQYFEGIARGNNIIISCMSGVGISSKIKEIIEQFVNYETMDIIIMDYKNLKSLIEQNNKDNFKYTKLIITTSNLPQLTSIPWVNAYDILDGKGERYLWEGLKSEMDKQKFESMKREFVKFFSIEGIASRLTFLNPNVVINEVEDVIYRYEQYYNTNLIGHIKLNLYMHIAFMIERLMTSDNYEPEEKVNYTDSEREFYEISKDVFRKIEKKYHIKINQYELSLLYDLFKNVIL
ncbi:sigma 54-interacting transcriptional regulator [Clostridium tyrobutyricum]|uniref:sigma 54-interacting transcriptional regulator n=1 Tax=Clostridium tyrobutyricum TaxID=1519 RepID=UPI001C3E2AFE|nr:sigma 54-interacting transcriptional regulator [Clostridium tyrobutyricum]MBV4438539.1 sigma 54-interacting transcriptional regulator [Clostridium tyrobutyricum]